MEQNQKSPEQSRGNMNDRTPSQDDAKNAPAPKTDAEKEEAEKAGNKKHKTSAAAINSIIGSATENVRAGHIEKTLGNTGTNVSYEGPTSTAAGGTGYNSGQPATGAKISTDDAYDSGGVARTENEANNEADEKDII